MTFETFETTTASASQCGLVSHAADNEANDEWRLHIPVCVHEKGGILDIGCNNGCSMFSVNIFTLNS